MQTQAIAEGIWNSDERFRAVADAAPVMILITDPAGLITYGNRGVLEFTGSAEETLAGVPLSASVHPDDRGRYVKALREASANQTAFAIDVQLLRADGEYRWIALWGNPLHSPSRIFLGHISSAIDITARRAISMKLQETSDRLTTLIEALPDAVILKDASFRWQMANRAAIDLLGLAAVDWRGRTDEQLATLLPRQRETFEALAESDRLAREKGSRYDSVDLIVDPGGLYRYFEASRVPLRGPRDECRGVVLLGRNATDRRIAEEALLLAASVFEENLDGIIVTGADQRILRVNKAFTRISGFTPEEVLGRTPRVLRSGRHGPGFYKEMWDSIHSSGQWRGEIWNRRKNGEVYPEWLVINTVRDALDKVTHYVGTFSDLAEQKRMEREALRLMLESPSTGQADRCGIQEEVLLRAAPGQQKD